MLYKLLLDTINSNSDLVVRLEAAVALKLAIDDFSFDPEQFRQFQQSACSGMFELLVQCVECDTKMRIVYIYSLILKRQRGLNGEIGIIQLCKYLPKLWEHANEHHLLRGAIVSLLLGKQHLNPLARAA